MASEVDIANLALAHLGDDATVSSIDPPEGSAQAEHCQRFYPIARDALIEMHTWNFTTKRAAPALIASTITEWQYSYALPSDAVGVISVLPYGATDDYSAGAATSVGYVSGTGLFDPSNSPARYQPVPFAVETLDDGTLAVYTNAEDPDIRYTARVTDTSKFSPLFTTALSWLLASYLAGPLLKGEAGQAAAANCLKTFSLWFAKATQSDALQRHTNVQQSVAWMAGRS